MQGAQASLSPFSVSLLCSDSATSFVAGGRCSVSGLGSLLIALALLLLYRALSRKRRVEQSCGWVADFCPHCGEISAIHRLLVSEVRGFCSLPVSPLGVGGHAMCAQCSRELVSGSGYRTSVPRQLATLDDLIAATFPDVRTVRAAELAAAAQRRAELPRLSDDARLRLAAEQLLACEDTVARQFAVSWRDRALPPSSTRIVLLAPLLLIPVYELTGKDERYLWLLVPALLGPIAVVICLMATARTRHIRKYVLPSFARTCADLELPAAALAGLLARARQQKLILGQTLSPARLAAAIDRERARRQHGAAAAR